VKLSRTAKIYEPHGKPAMAAFGLFLQRKYFNLWRNQLFQIDSNAETYKAHLESLHFRKYKSSTKEMVKSLELVDLDPVILGAKSK
jgi:hypothetical protein